MPSLEKEDLCQPNTKINVLEEPGGGALLDVCAPGKNVGRLGSASLLYRLRLQPLLQLRREVCLRPSERGSVMLCLLTHHHIPPKAHPGAVGRPPNTMSWNQELR